MPLERAAGLWCAVALVAWLLASGPASSGAAGDDAFGVIPSIDATVTGLRFFEAGRQAPPLGQRRYDDRFLHHPAPWMYWELSLAHPPSGRRATFTLEEVWHGPGGGVAYRGSRTFTLEGHWKGSTWWGSARLIEGKTVTVAAPRMDVFRCRGVTGEWGPCETTAETRLEYWPTGHWRVELLVDKRPIATGRFLMVTRKALDGEIRGWLADRSGPTHRIASLGGRVTSLRLFADDGGPSSGRQYESAFPRSIARIGWDLEVEHAEPRRWVPVTFEARWLQTAARSESWGARCRRSASRGTGRTRASPTFPGPGHPGAGPRAPSGSICISTGAR